MMASKRAPRCTMSMSNISVPRQMQKIEPRMCGRHKNLQLSCKVWLSVEERAVVRPVTTASPSVKVMEATKGKRYLRPFMRGGCSCPQFIQVHNRTYDPDVTKNEAIPASMKVECQRSASTLVVMTDASLGFTTPVRQQRRILRTKCALRPSASVVSTESTSKVGLACEAIPALLRDAEAMLGGVQRVALDRASHWTG